MQRTFVTGANGFLGSALMHRFQRDQRPVLGAVRHAITAPSWVQVESLEPCADWRSALEGQDVVIHTAARVHVMQESAADPIAEFRRVNVEGTLNLASQAAEVGARRFIYISSIKVNGEGTHVGKPYSADDMPAPADPYGVSKREAEDGLRNLATDIGMEVVIIRPPLVYGPGVKGNFLSMMRWLNKGVPLPLGSIRNRRSLVALDNLVDLLMCCVAHPAAADGTFLVSDGEDLSTPELVRRLAAAMGRRARLIPIPERLLLVAGRLAGLGTEVGRLCGSLQVDMTATRERLGWTPPVRADDALRETAKAFLRASRA